VTEPLFTLLTVLAGLLLRLGLPLGVTALIVWLLRKLDARWQAEARQQAGPALATAPAVPCWIARHCPEALRARCPAYARPDVPCWQVFRDAQGRLKPICLGCEVFRQAPAPALTQSVLKTFGVSETPKVCRGEPT